MFIPDTKFSVGDTAYTNSNGKVYKFDVCRVTIMIDRDRTTVLYHGGTEDVPDCSGVIEEMCFDSEKEARLCFIKNK